MHAYSLETITIDSTPPAVSSFVVAPVISGNTVLTVSTSPDTTSVTYSIKPSADTVWTQAATSTTGPGFAGSFATNAFPDGTYDIRTTVTDAFGNTHEHRRLERRDRQHRA